MCSQRNSLFLEFSLVGNSFGNLAAGLDLMIVAISPEGPTDTATDLTITVPK
jgi:hypothetical protein